MPYATYCTYLEELGCDGEPVATRQLQHLALAPEAGSHDNRTVSVLLVVAVDLGHANAARVFRRGVRLTGLLLVKVQDAPHERGDQSSPSLGARGRLKRGRERSGGWGGHVIAYYFSGAAGDKEVARPLHEQQVHLRKSPVARKQRGAISECTTLVESEAVVFRTYKPFDTRCSVPYATFPSHKVLAQQLNSRHIPSRLGCLHLWLVPPEAAPKRPRYPPLTARYPHPLTQH